MEKRVREICDGLSSSILEKVKASMDSIGIRLLNRSKDSEKLGEALNQIVDRYCAAEEAIIRNDMENCRLEDYSAKRGSVTDDDRKMEQYGYSDTSIQYLQDYYPELLEELYVSSNPDDVLDRINSILETNHIAMMEGYGYSYAAIKYLLDNHPEMIGALHTTSRWSLADVDNVRQEIYNICHEHDICVYDPNYAFDPYNIGPGEYVGVSSVQAHTNCYAYAFGLIYNPITGDFLPLGGLQPGYLSGNTDYVYFNSDLIYSRENQGEEFISIVQQDAEAIDLNFVPYEEGMEGGTRVSLVIRPSDDPKGSDYHWYYYDEASGTWYNKQGMCPATDCHMDFSNRTEYDESVEITDEDAIFFYDANLSENIYLMPGIADYGEEIGSDYVQHAEANGYIINCGEFYITTQDGSDFQ